MDATTEALKRRRSIGPERMTRQIRVAMPVEVNERLRSARPAASCSAPLAAGERGATATGPVRPAGGPERAHKRPGATQGYFSLYSPRSAANRRRSARIRRYSGPVPGGRQTGVLPGGLPALVERLCPTRRHPRSAPEAASVTAGLIGRFEAGARLRIAHYGL